MNPFITDYLSLYDLFVNKVFGDVWFATIGLFGLFILLSVLLRMSFLTSLTISGLFVIAFTSNAGNPWIVFLSILVILGYLAYQLVRYFNSEGYT